MANSRQNEFLREQAGLAVEHAAGVERLEHPLQPHLEGVHAHQGHHARDQAFGIAADVVDIGQRFAEAVRRLADHRHRQVAAARVLREQSEEGLDHARRKAVADHDAVDVARLDMLGSGFDAERADHLDTLAHGDAERGIERAAADDQHGGVVECVGHGKLRHRAALRGGQFDAAQNGGVQRAHAHGRLQARDHGLERLPGIDRQREGNGGVAVLVGERHCRHQRSVHGRDLQAEHARGGFGRRRPRLGNHHAGRLDRDEGGRGIGPFGFDDGESAGRAQRFDEAGRRLVGHHDQRTLKRHGSTRGLLNPRLP